MVSQLLFGVDQSDMALQRLVRLPNVCELLFRDTSRSLLTRPRPTVRLLPKLHPGRGASLRPDNQSRSAGIDAFALVDHSHPEVEQEMKSVIRPFGTRMPDLA